MTNPHFVLLEMEMLLIEIGCSAATLGHVAYHLSSAPDGINTLHVHAPTAEEAAGLSRILGEPRVSPARDSNRRFRRMSTTHPFDVTVYDWPAPPYPTTSPAGEGRVTEERR